MDLKSMVRDIPDFPKKGILFKDISPLLTNGEAFHEISDQMTKHYVKKAYQIDKVVSAESRGFIFGALLANTLHAGFVPLRKPGKLPWKTIKQEFETEYSTDGFEVHIDAIQKGDNCIIVDDILATGGTANAAIKLVEELGGNVKELFFLAELDFLNGRKQLENYPIHSLIHYGDGE
jgi:adenine phosphoribosyltransferase